MHPTGPPVTTGPDVVGLLLAVVVVGKAGPTAVPLSTPEQVPEPGTLVLPPAYTVGPGMIYVLRAGWMSALIPGSVAAYAPGRLTSPGAADPPPVTVIWTAKGQREPESNDARTYSNSSRIELHQASLQSVKQLLLVGRDSLRLECRWGS